MTFLPISVGGGVVRILLQAYVIRKNGESWRRREWAEILGRQVTAAKAQQGPLSCCKYDEAI